MLLDFGKDVLISTIVVWNRIDDGRINRIIGCTLSIISNANITVFSQPFDKVQEAYEYDFGPRPSTIIPSPKIPIYARYIKLQRVYKTPIPTTGDNIINILGIDVYDAIGTFISDQSTPYMSAVTQGNVAQNGPQYLIDGVHQKFKADGSCHGESH